MVWVQHAALFHSSAEVHLKHFSPWNSGEWFVQACLYTFFFFGTPFLVLGVYSGGGIADWNGLSMLNLQRKPRTSQPSGWATLSSCQQCTGLLASPGCSPLLWQAVVFYCGFDLCFPDDHDSQRLITTLLTIVIILRALTYTHLRAHETRANLV